jgi:uncharacterized membrane protein
MKKLIMPKLVFVACHKIPERSFFYKGKQFPVCARCTGMLLGYLSFPLYVLHIFTANIFIVLALNIPAYIDGLTQAANLRESNNTLRLITGLLSGIGQMGIVSYIGNYLGLLILKLIKGEI